MDSGAGHKSPYGHNESGCYIQAQSPRLMNFYGSMSIPTRLPAPRGRPGDRGQSSRRPQGDRGRRESSHEAPKSRLSAHSVPLRDAAEALDLHSRSPGAMCRDDAGRVARVLPERLTPIIFRPRQSCRRVGLRTRRPRIQESGDLRGGRRGPVAAGGPQSTGGQDAAAGSSRSTVDQPASIDGGLARRGAIGPRRDESERFLGCRVPGPRRPRSTVDHAIFPVCSPAWSRDSPWGVMAGHPRFDANPDSLAVRQCLGPGAWSKPAWSTVDRASPMKPSRPRACGWISLVSTSLWSTVDQWPPTGRGECRFRPTISPCTAPAGVRLTPTGRVCAGPPIKPA